MKKNSEYVGVDEKYIPEDDKYVDESVLGNKQESERKIKKFLKAIITFFLIFFGFAIAMVIAIFISSGNMFFKTGKIINSISEKNINIQEVDSFNSKFEIYRGTSSKIQVNLILDEVVANNKKNKSKIVTVEYNDNITSAPEEIINLKNSFEESKKYEIILDYDLEGFVNKVKLQNI